MAGNYKHDRLTYAAFVSMLANRETDPLAQQEIRAKYFGKTHRVECYKEYRAYCENNDYRYDDAPEFILEDLKENTFWQSLVGYMFAAMAVWLWMAIGTATKTIRRG